MTIPAIRTARLAFLAAAAAVLVTVILDTSPVRADPTPRGYQPRMCGLDMNRNGVIGEAADCNVCDGVTADPDGDGTDEDLIYVSCPAGGPFVPGTDVPGCGAPGSPCASITYAWQTIADGPGDGAEDIVCFRNRCAETSLGPAQGGVPGTYLVPKSGSEERDWNYPSDPTILVGWDTDNDGAYPPEDADDLAVLDGSSFNEFDPGTAGNPTNIDSGLDPRNKNRTFELNNSDDYVEIAHFTTEKYGFESNKLNTGFLHLSESGDVDYLYIHDLRMIDTNVGHQSKFPPTVISPPNPVPDPGEQLDISGSFVPTFNLFRGQFHWANFTNLDMQGSIVWVARGVGNAVAPDEGPLRWKNLTVMMDGCGEPEDPGEAALGYCRRLETNGWKMWSYISDIEILDTILDIGLAGKTLASSGNRANSFAFTPVQCSQGWTIRNNEIIDFKLGVKVQASDASFCRHIAGPGGGTPDGVVARPVRDIVIDRNIFRSTHPWGFGTNVISTENDSGDLPDLQLVNITITNNVIYATRYDSCIWLDHSHFNTPVPGRSVVANNACVGKPDRFGAISLGDVEQHNDKDFLPQDIVIKNNIITNITGNDFNFETTYMPTNLEMDHNTYNESPLRRFGWAGTDVVGLAAWQALSGYDMNSAECTPAFADAGNFDYHLDPSDTCAQDQGTGTVAVFVSVDIDNEARGQGAGWDIGADEVPAGLMAEADLALTVKAQPASTNVGGTVRYLVMVTNLGPDNAPDSIVSVTIPAELSYAGDSCSAGPPQAGIWQWDLGTVEPNANARTRPRCLITLNGAQAGTGSLATGITSTADDPDAGNNDAMANVTVN